MDRDTISEEERDGVSIVGLLKPLWRHRRLLAVLTLASTALAIVLAGIHYLRQPVLWEASLEFRPTFQGADLGRYPNTLPFAPSDITDPSVLDQVFDTNKLQDFCARADLRSAIFVTQHSSELEIIDSDYQSRLADERLTTVDRQRIVDEYRARRLSLPSQYGLTFIRPAACSTLPAQVAVKMLDDILLTWANDSESRRGVLKQRVKLLTPSIFDVAMVEKQSLFVRANLAWTNIDRIILNLTEIETLPGAELVRFGEQRMSFAEVRARLEDLQHVHLQSLVALIGAEQNRDSIRWVENALATATSQQQLAQDRAAANLSAFREYSGVLPRPNLAGKESQGSQGATNAQSVVAQIDMTFIDRILEMSTVNSTFRQELTRFMVKAQLEAVEYKSIVDHYKQLLATLKSGVGGSSASDLSARLSGIVSEAKKLTADFNSLYTEWSRVSLRVGPAMYHTEKPGTARVVREFGLFTYVKPITLVFFATLILAVLAALVHTHLWPALVADK